LKAITTARCIAKKEARPAAKVAGALNPFMDCSEIEGLSGDLHEDTRGAVFAVMGDAYRREGNMELAAKWYRRASQISAGDHVPVYAHLVCKHQLAEFYEDVLRIHRDHQRRWQAKPRMTRFVRRLGMWANRETREIVRREKRDLEFLRSQVMPQAA
jgi:hypothetical protein